MTTLVFVFGSEADAITFVDSFSTQVIAAKKKQLPTSLNQALKGKLEGGPKKFKPVAPRKSALDAKVDAELACHKSLGDIQSQI